MHQALMQAVVVTPKDAYEECEEVEITVSVVDADGPLEGAAVRIEVTNGNGVKMGGAAETDEHGVSSVTYKVVTARDGVGTYLVDASVSNDGFDSGLSSTTFEVKPPSAT